MGESSVVALQKNSMRKREFLIRSLLWLSQSYCGETILHATFLINRYPLSLLLFKTPFELLYGAFPEYENLKPFGCLCFARTIHAYRKKLMLTTNFAYSWDILLDIGFSIFKQIGSFSRETSYFMNGFFIYRCRKEKFLRVISSLLFLSMIPWRRFMSPFDVTFLVEG
ncbi:LOW QUALITY PROTEIN: hypothetical protein V2J09_017626 [Rumex salicifolius]